MHIVVDINILIADCLFGCESSPISPNVRQSVRSSVDKCKVRLIKAQ